ncbi:MAG: hypothetical protein ACR2PH_04825, partial [Desulfobulbia bacterium]
MKLEFLEGEVEAVGYNEYVTQFKIAGSGAIVDVRNDIHIRFVEDIYNPPPSFMILAPMTAVDIVEGDIPKKYRKIYPINHYKKLNDEYHEKAQKQINTRSSVPELDAESAENYYVTQSFKKEDLDVYFNFIRSDWEHYSQNMNFPETANAKVSVKNEENNFVIHVKMGDPKKFAYIITGMFGNNEKRIYAYKMEQIFPHGFLEEDQKRVYRNVDQTNNP